MSRHTRCAACASAPIWSARQIAIWPSSTFYKAVYGKNLIIESEITSSLEYLNKSVSSRLLLETLKRFNSLQIFDALNEVSARNRVNAVLHAGICTTSEILLNAQTFFGGMYKVGRAQQQELKYLITPLMNRTRIPSNFKVLIVYVESTPQF